MKKLIYLGSSSPRRRELLKPFFRLKILSPDIDEAVRKGEAPQSYVVRVARDKWAKLVQEHSAKSGVLVTADTSVCLGNQILGKGESALEATRILRKLSGSRHEVVTAVCVGRLGAGERPRVKKVVTQIRFRSLLSFEIQAYVKSGEWRGKAGAYGIQGLASCFVDEIRGSFTNVIGLPLAETLDLIDQAF